MAEYDDVVVKLIICSIYYTIARCLKKKNNIYPFLKIIIAF